MELPRVNGSLPPNLVGDRSLRTSSQETGPPRGAGVGFASLRDYTRVAPRGSRIPRHSIMEPSPLLPGKVLNASSPLCRNVFRVAETSPFWMIAQLARLHEDRGRPAAAEAGNLGRSEPLPTSARSPLGLLPFGRESEGARISRGSLSGRFPGSVRVRGMHRPAIAKVPLTRGADAAPGNFVERGSRSFLGDSGKGHPGAVPCGGARP